MGEFYFVKQEAYQKRQKKSSEQQSLGQHFTIFVLVKMTERLCLVLILYHKVCKR